MLDIVASYHCIQFQGEIMIHTKENGQKPHFRPDLDLLGQNLGSQKNVYKLVVRHSSKHSFYII